MASSISNFLENTLQELVFNSVTPVFTGAVAVPAGIYVKLHIGDPGEDCTSNEAGTTLRKVVTFGASANGVVASDTAAVTWTAVGVAETISHISLWDAVTAGNALWYGSLGANRVLLVNDNLTIAIGALTVTLA